MLAVVSFVILLASINPQPSVLQVGTSDRAPVGRCHVIQELPPATRSTVEQLCREALERIETKLGIEIRSPLEFALSDPQHPVAGTDVAVIRVAAVDSLELLTRLGVLQHEVGHLAVLTWLREANATVGGDGYATSLPDVLDEGLAMLAEPPSVRVKRRPSLASFDTPSFREVLDLDHPGMAALNPLDAFTRTTRRVLTPCPECPSPPFHPTRWVVITERVVIRGGVEGPLEADTTLWADEPPAPDVSSSERFFSLSEAAISFLSEQFRDPAQLSEFILDLIEQPDASPIPMLMSRLRLPEAEISARWAKWVREAAEVGIDASGT